MTKQGEKFIPKAIIFHFKKIISKLYQTHQQSSFAHGLKMPRTSNFTHYTSPEIGQVAVATKI
jgi:hypothetical protein